MSKGRHNVSNGKLNMVVRDRERHISGLLLRVHNENLIFLFLNQNICCGYSKEPSQCDGSFEHPKHMLKLMGKKIYTILH